MANLFVLSIGLFMVSRATNISRNDSFVADICSSVNEEFCSVSNEYGTQIGCDIAGLRIPGSTFPPTPKVEMEIWKSFDFNFCPEDISITISCSAKIKIEYMGKKYEEIVTNSIRIPLGYQSTTTLLSCKSMLQPLGLDFICTLGGYNIDITIDLIFTINILQLYVDIVLNLHNLYPKNILLFRPIGIGLPPLYMDILCFLSQLNNQMNTSSNNQIVVISKTDTNDYCAVSVDTTPNPTLLPTIKPITVLPTIKPITALPTIITAESEKSEVRSDNNNAVYIGSGVSVFAVLLILIVCYFCRNVNKKRKETQLTNISTLLKHDVM
eukprot:101938_1